MSEPKTAQTPEATPRQLDPTDVLKTLQTRSFAVLSTVSAAGWPHAAGVIYQLVDGVMYVSTDLSSRKARSIAENPRVAVMVPIRRMPVGAPPSSVQFQATAEILPLDDPDLVSLAGAGKLKKVTGHDELERPGGCFLRITPRPKLNTYGLGMSIIQLARDPLNAAGVAALPHAS